MRNINWWAVILATLFLFSFGLMLVCASLKLWVCAGVSLVCMVVAYILGQYLEFAP